MLEKILEKIGLSKPGGKLTRKSVDQLTSKQVEKKKIDKKEEDFMKNLPPGVVVKKIEVTPDKVLKWVLYGLLAAWLLFSLRTALMGQEVTKATFAEIVQTIKEDKAEELVISDNDLILKIKDSKKVMVASKEPGLTVAEYLQKEGVDPSKIKLTVDNNSLGKILAEIATVFLTAFLPIIILVWFFRRQSGGMGAGGMFGFGKSTAKLFVKGKQKVTFKDVAGVDEAKKDLEEVVDFLKNPQKYAKLGARVPKGVLLVGPSGVGKTLLAKAVAGEAEVGFLSMAGSEFMEMLVGVGASRVRDLFATAKKMGKAIIFIDEIDAIGRMRGGLEGGGGHGEREQTLNQILVEMDGFEPNTSVVVLAATNRGDLLDPALLRPGRFDRRVVLEYPDLEARKQILVIHAKNKPFVKGIDWDSVARRTVGFSGADLENMLNEAAISAAREGKTQITQENINEAALKVKIGPTKKRAQTEEDKLMTAYHEAGHAVVNYLTGLDPVHRVSIVSRGMALGYTLVPPSRDRIHETKERLLKQMMMSLGGRVAEELVFKDISTGASSDISGITNIARKMVTEWGMSDLGPINLGPSWDMADFGRAFVEPAKVSEGMQERVDMEVQKLINTAHEKTIELLKKNMKKLEEVAKVLVEKETVEEVEFEALMKK